MFTTPTLAEKEPPRGTPEKPRHCPRLANLSNTVLGKEEKKHKHKRSINTTRRKR